MLPQYFELNDANRLSPSAMADYLSMAMTDGYPKRCHQYAYDSYTKVSAFVVESGATMG